MEKKFNKIFVILYSLLFFITPLLMFDKTSELFEFNKILFIYFITILVACVWFFKCLSYKQLFFKRTFFDIPVLLFLLTQILSFVFSIDRHTSFFGYYGRFNGGLLSTLSYILLLYAFVSNVDIKASVNKILKVNLLSSALVALWAIPDKFGFDLTCWIFTGSAKISCWTDQFRPAERAFSTLGQPNWLGAYLAFNLILGIYFLSKEYKKKKHLVMWVLYIFLNAYVIYFTKSKTTYFSVVAALIMWAIVYIYSKIKLNRNKIVFATITLVLPLFIFCGIFLNSFSNLKVTNSQVTDSLEIRQLVWKGALDLARKYPLFGTGPETFAYSYYFTRPTQSNISSEWDFIYNKAHNEYLNYMATTGILGFLAYSFLIFSFFYFVLKNTQGDEKYMNIAFLCGFVTILVNNFTGFSITTINLYFYLVFAFVIVRNSELELLRLGKINYLKGITILAPLLFMIFGVNYVLNYFLADINYAVSDNYTRTQEYEKSVNYLNRALKYKYEHVYQDKLSNVYANLALVEATRGQEAATNNYFKESIKLNYESLDESPLNIFYWKTRAKNYYYFYQLNQDDEFFKIATSSLKIARSIAPTDPKVLHTEAIFYTLRADNEKDKAKMRESLMSAISLLNNAIKLKPNYYDAYLLRGQTYKKINENEKAKIDFEYILKSIVVNDVEAKRELEGL